MKQKLLNSFKLRVCLLVAVLCAGFTSAWGDEVTLTAGTNGSACKVNNQDGIKVGTSSKGGDMTITVPANTTKLTLHAAAWKGVTGLSLNISQATVSPTSISLTADNGISNNSPFTLSGNESDFLFEVTLSGITKETAIKFTSSSAKRFVVWGASAVVSGGGSQTETVATPTFSPAAGTYTSEQNVEITTATEGATIYYTTDGATPTTSSSLYSSAITVSETQTIKAIAVKDGLDNSSVASATYTIVNLAHAGTQADPYTVADARTAIDANGTIEGAYVTGIISQIDSYNSNYNSITYWISDDGTTTGQLEVYSGKGLGNTNFNSVNDVLKGATVVVYGTLKKYNTTYEFDKNNYLTSYTAPAAAVEAPTFSPVAGTYDSNQSVTISTTTTGATIYYTTDGSNPTSSSNVYSSAISVSDATTIKAIAIKGSDESTIATATYHICSAASPYTVTQALAFNEYPANGIYVTGIVSTAPTEAPSSGALTYYISVDGTTNDQLEVYKGKGLNDAAFTAQSDIQVGDIVTIYGNVKDYQGTIEFDKDNYLVAFERPAVPSITVSSNSLTGFTYEEGNGPSTTQSFTVSGANLTADISLSLSGSDFEISNADNGTYGNSLTLTQSSGTVAETTVYVRLKENKTANSYNEDVTLTSTGATSVTVSLSGSVTVPAGPNVTWDLSTNSYSSASTTEVAWTSSQATMTLAKGSSSTNANNYLGGGNNGNYVHTRFYKDQNLTFTPASGYTITSIELTATTNNYATNFAGYTWSNGSATSDAKVVTVIPTNGASPVSVTPSAVGYFTSVKVYYAVSSTPSISVNTTLNVTSDEASGTIDVTYNNIDDNSSAEVILCDNEGNTTTYDWILVDLDNNKDVDYVIGANIGAERTAYLKVKVGNVSSDIVTITQGKYTVYNSYTLATSVTPGKHYVIASGTSGTVQVMAQQGNDNRKCIEASIIEGTLKVDVEADAHEFIIYGTNGYYTFYDVTSGVEGYLYAASSSANQLKTQATNDLKGKWNITFNEGEASIVAKDDNMRNVMQFNNTLFACYASASQSPVYLFEKAGNPEATTTSVTLNSSGYATFASTSTLDFLDYENANYSAWQITSISGETITFEQVTETVAAGTGLLLKGSGTATLNILPTGGKTLSSNKLEGITVATEISANQYYGLKGNEFVPVNGGTVPAGKALLPVSALSNNVKSYTFVFVDAETGIRTVETVSAEEAAEIFNLAGQRLQKAQRGVNIINGKKVLVK